MIDIIKINELEDFIIKDTINSFNIFSWNLEKATSINLVLEQIKLRVKNELDDLIINDESDSKALKEKTNQIILISKKLREGAGEITKKFLAFEHDIEAIFEEKVADIVKKQEEIKEERIANNVAFVDKKVNEFKYK
jgi:hypothetical protein